MLFFKNQSKYIVMSVTISLVGCSDRAVFKSASQAPAGATDPISHPKVPDLDFIEADESPSAIAYETRPSVTLLANGKAGTILVSKGAPPLISWESKNAAECSLYDEFDNFVAEGLVGQVVYDNPAVAALVIKCLDGSGNPADDDLIITYLSVNDDDLTTDGSPSLVLTANGEFQSLVIEEGMPVSINWDSANVISCVVSSSTTGTISDSKPSGDHVLTNLTSETGDVIISASCIGADGTVITDELTIDFFKPEPAYPQTTIFFTAGESFQAPIDIIFAVDSSGSMTGDDQELENFSQEFANFMQLFAQRAGESNLDYRVYVVGEFGSGTDKIDIPSQAKLTKIQDPINSHNAFSKIFNHSGQYGADTNKELVVVTDDFSDWSKSQYDAAVAANSKFTDKTILSGMIGFDSGCESNAGPVYESIILEAGGFVEDICQVDWNTVLLDLGEAIFTQNAQTEFQLIETPISDAVFQIEVDSLPVSTADYTYDEMTNTIVFDTAPDIGANVQVTYNHN
jgi:hypothetical protein